VGVWAAQMTRELCQELRQYRGEQMLKAIQPEILPDLEKNALRSASSAQPDSERAVLAQLKNEIKFIQESFWQIVQTPRARPVGTRADVRKLLLQYISRLGCAKEDAESIAHDALLRALTRLYQYEPKPGKNFMNWLYTIAWTSFVNTYRGQKRGGRSLGEDEEDTLTRPRAKPLERKAMEDILAVQVVSCLVAALEADTANVARVLICALHQIVGYSPQEIMEEEEDNLAGLSLDEILSEFRKVCLRFDAFNQNVELLNELFEPFSQALEQRHESGKRLGEMKLQQSWQGQSKGSYFIQNASRRVWARVEECVQKSLG
jgi:DNA-directed RNA polymerase specialized sigma24 family protein